LEQRRERLFFIDPAPTSEHHEISPREAPQPLGIAQHELFFLAMHPNGSQIVFADDEWRNPLGYEEPFQRVKAAR
jgi:hypothetical protein